MVENHVKYEQSETVFTRTIKTDDRRAITVLLANNDEINCS